jgi:phosphate-selective porin OprO/OprP
MSAKILPRLTALCVAAAIALPALSPATAAPAPATRDGGGWRGDLDDDGYRLRNGDIDIEIGGRLQFDVLNADSDQRDVGNRSGLRRAGLGITTTWRDDLQFNASASFDEDGAALSGLSVAWSGIEDVRLRVGKFGSLVGMERRASSSDTLLMERGLPNALTARASWGASAGYANGGLSAEVAYFTDWYENDVQTRGSEGKGVAGRLAWRSDDEADVRVHVGVSGEVREPDRGLYRVRARPEAELVESRLLDTSLLRDVNERTTLGAEAALLAGPFVLQAEYLTSELERSAGDATLSGGYVQAGWVLTGESRRYRSRAAAIGSVRPKGDTGAVELVARYSTLDLEDGGIGGGEGTVMSTGVNWFVTPWLRLSLDVGRAEGEPNRSGRNEQVDFVQGRLQLAL